VVVDLRSGHGRYQVGLCADGSEQKERVMQKDKHLFFIRILLFSSKKDNSP